MASTFAVTRNHLVFGICLPLALLLGYLLADAQDPMSKLLIAALCAGLCIPLMMSWYHPILFFVWNMGATPLLLPGRPYLWSVVSVLAFAVFVINRTLSADKRFPDVPILTRPMIGMVLVVVLTALALGGIGLSMLQSNTVGGKNYFLILFAIAGFFALGSKAIPVEKAHFYLALFFLPSLFTAASTIAAWIGPAANFVYYMFPPDIELNEFISNPESVAMDQVRWRGLGAASVGLFLWVLARYGVRDIFDYTRPWRLIFLLGLMFIGMLGGFRSMGISMLMVLAALFTLERLWRSQVMLVVVAATAISVVLLVGFAEHLPFSVQRSLSFLPIDIDPAARESAINSSEWRLEMWREAWKQVPEYLFKGKGYTAQATDMYMVNFAMMMGHTKNWEWALLSGDYHNGPLSLLLTFGIWGMAAFLWLWVAGCVFLYRNFKNSRPELVRINTFIFGYFVVKGLFFLGVYGAIAHDLYIFTGLLGFSVALNVARPVTEELPGFSGTFRESQPSS